MDEGYETTMGGYEPPDDLTSVHRPVGGGVPAEPVAESATGRMAPVGASGPPAMAPSRAAGRSALAGMLVMLVGAWGGAAAYFGPKIGIGPLGDTAWRWSTAHTVLSLAPGAAAVVGGLLILFGARLLAGGIQRLGGLLAFGAGGWFVLGAAVYPVFYGTAAPGYLQTGRGPLMNLASVAAYGPGVGIALCALSGMAMAWSGARLLRSRRTAPDGMRRSARPASAGLPLRNTDPVGA